MHGDVKFIFLTLICSTYYILHALKEIKRVTFFKRKLAPKGAFFNTHKNNAFQFLCTLEDPFPN